ncbi:hypothetical protein ACGFZQ_37050 [Streptomyces sp. NPDC048254]|uniref:hypothetical protein n=1 Tax=Streptomyces sp. NPDC048254 TaxID=3365525 RepID=UPI00371AF974
MRNPRFIDLGEMWITLRWCRQRTASSATEGHAVHFHHYHVEDMSRVTVRTFCEVEDREVRSD